MTKYYLEPAKSIPVKHEVDVLVIGGGPAGFSAAVNAARRGAKTMLIEQSGSVGGVATSGLMSHWTGETKGGFYEEILSRSEYMEEGPSMGGHGTFRQVINHERLKTVMLQMLEEAGVIVQLYTFASAPILEDKTITGVITESKSGRESIMAAIVIDASGDGDIAAGAGAPHYLGREYDGKMQPMTIMLQVAGVDTSQVRYVHGFEETYDLPGGDIQTLGRQHIPYPAGHVLIYPSPLPGIVTLNMTNSIKVNGTKAEDLTRATVTCRNQIEPIIQFLREFVPGFENCFVINSSAQIGVRETRHFIGEQTLNEQDIMVARVFDDWAVANVHFNFDVHNLSGAGLDETGEQKHFKQKKGYTIPYGCFVPAEVDNLLLAGRNISGTHMAHSSFRVMPICANMGQSVGIAAALCKEKGCKPRSLDVKLLQEELIKLGVKPDE
ncbi:FAD-dependent oxidoreductase [Paenibacillus etheri]|uniref:Pyridine nucleotide-disulfide oxidoreductase n=1 Tax=Paenibacillus etheri TaxID=1306852 RepID=A0A0W1AVR7_9BACL|nr:FAD-dependent oxidoreductase [Paenibacillus etheri]KTD85446.1 pyridine nucleotide-disulfide oxidoreductase [Paenibacillus etheri]